MTSTTAAALLAILACSGCRIGGSTESRQAQGRSRPPSPVAVRPVTTAPSSASTNTIISPGFAVARTPHPKPQTPAYTPPSTYAHAPAAAHRDHASLPPQAASQTEPPSFTATPLDQSPATDNVSRITFADEGADFDPCASSDGKHLVFASTQHRNSSDIYIKRVDSRVVTQLTSDPAEDAMPSISPDGQRIAFASNRAGSWDVYVMPTSGGKAVQLTSDESDEIHPSWSPDGRQIVFSRHGARSGRWEMWVAEVQNPAIANFIGYGLFPRWCPIAGTGQGGADRILFQLGRERGRRAFGLWTIDYSSGRSENPTQIAGSPSTALINPTWSPDGQWIVYAEVPLDAPEDYRAGDEVRTSSASLWMLSIEGEGKVRVTTGPGVALSPTWGTTNRLFFVSNRGGADNIWSLDLSPAITSAQAAIGNPQHPQPPVATVGEHGEPEPNHK